MNTLEEEFQCSDCGHTVSVSDEICPNCGASLETFSIDDDSEQFEYECSECGAGVSPGEEYCGNCGAALYANSGEKSVNEEKVVEIPLSYDPVKLSALRSLLDENNFNYTIDGDDLQNIWGPGLIHSQKLLVRIEELKKVKEIISSFNNNDISITEENVSGNGLSTGIDTVNYPDGNEKTRELKGVKGFLLVLILILILSPIAVMPLTTYDFFEMQLVIQKFPLLYNAVVLDLFTGIYLSFLSINAGIKLYKIKPDAVNKTSRFFNIIIVYQIISFFGIAILFTIYKIPFESEMKGLFGTLLRETIYSIVYTAAAKLYLKNSERVKNTFG